MSEEERILHTAKRKRLPSLQAGPRKRKNCLQRSPSLFSSGSPFKSLRGLGPPIEESESLARIIGDRISSMPRDKLPVVTEICFRLYPYGPYAFNAYQYTAMIKTDPSRRELSDSRISKLIKGMGYTWKIDDTEHTDILSPDWTRVDGLIIDPSKEESDTPVLSSDSSSDPSDDDDDSEPSSNNRDSSEAVWDRELEKE